MLKMFKRDLSLCAGITALVILCALAWGRPFVWNHPNAVHGQTRRVQIFHGAVFSDGQQFFLRDSSGVVLPIEDPQEAQAFIGKTVTITGSLDGEKLIRVMSIEPAA